MCDHRGIQFHGRLSAGYQVIQVCSLTQFNKLEASDVGRLKLQCQAKSECLRDTRGFLVPVWSAKVKDPGASFAGATGGGKISLQTLQESLFSFHYSSILLQGAHVALFNNHRPFFSGNTPKYIQKQHVELLSPVKLAPEINHRQFVLVTGKRGPEQPCHGFHHLCVGTVAL